LILTFLMAWAKALQLAVHIYNWTPHKVNGGKSPYFALTGEQPKLDKYLYPFGAKVNTNRLAPLPKDRKSVTTKWIYKIKYNKHSTVDHYKAHWVARGFTQLNGIDYFKTTSPVVCMENLRLVTGHAMLHSLDIPVVDVKNAFLQSEMKEEEMIYITQPEGYVNSDHHYGLCLLLKSLYRIKQAPRVWSKTLHKFLIDPCVYTRINKMVKTLMTVYVDDLTLIGMPHNISEIKKLLASMDLVPAKSIFGVEVI